MQCVECNREFEPAKSWQQFCSPKCRNDWHYKEQKRAAYCAELAAAGADNGHGAREEKIDLAQLGLAPPAAPIKRRRIVTA